MQLIW